MVAVFAVTTFATRVFAFIIFARTSKKNAGETSGGVKGGGVEYLGRVLPCAITAMLVVYCLRNTRVTLPPNGMPETLAVLITAGVYLCLKKFDCGMIAAIAVGTAAYMAMVQVVFV